MFVYMFCLIFFFYRIQALSRGLVIFCIFLTVGEAPEKTKTSAQFCTCNQSLVFLLLLSQKDQINPPLKIVPTKCTFNSHLSKIYEKTTFPSCFKEQLQILSKAWNYTRVIDFKASIWFKRSSLGTYLKMSKIQNNTRLNSVIYSQTTFRTNYVSVYRFCFYSFTVVRTWMFTGDTKWSIFCFVFSFGSNSGPKFSCVIHYWVRSSSTVLLCHFIFSPQRKLVAHSQKLLIHYCKLTWIKTNPITYIIQILSVSLLL